MRIARRSTHLALPAFGTSALILAAVPMWDAAADTIEYELVDVWLDPDVTHPWEPPRQMFGTLTWTYTPGDFENGVGTLSNIDLPWWSETTAPPLAHTIDTGSIEITMVGKWHDYGVDVQLVFVDALVVEGASLDLSASIFEIQVGVARQGHMVSGTLVPVLPASCPADIDGSGEVGPADLATLLGAWGPCSSCAADINADGLVGADDLAAILSAWGVCR